MVKQKRLTVSAIAAMCLTLALVVGIARQPVAAGVTEVVAGDGGREQGRSSPAQREVPRTWDDKAIAELEVPLADPVGSPKHVSADYYYRIPVRPIYKGYPVYAPGHEPPNYKAWLAQQEPQLLWGTDATGREVAPPLTSRRKRPPRR